MNTLAGNEVDEWRRFRLITVVNLLHWYKFREGVGIANNQIIDEGKPYCICGRPNFGMMIGCDDAGCEFKWFHLACISTTGTPPQSDFVCPSCRTRKVITTEGLSLSSRMRQGSGATGRRVGGRVFSPTTGVDIFKRGSEEVLARFLMQDPSGWGGTRDASQGPPTPSVIQ
ncbi:hypothetical protein M408DRAFT_91663 [Serendipita vermifera MAFF 305830]|uniref:PHD-type domain-containing protein n=1 Tax=Serendipita vermifera MAFF 305830 TaxID=933852 RepID=A0A0C3BQ24_SERVB|nr:hypothetical protein M408DRAFT_91663 [Serendipita vermifera MAFF 305830]